MAIFKILLATHIVCGGTSLILGLYVLLTKKGDKKHRRAGAFYFYSMLLAAVVALPMSVLHPNYFLFIIGLFTMYMLLTGKRYLKNRNPSMVKPIDWILAGMMCFFGLVLLGAGGYYLLHSNTFGIVFCVFGAISLLFVYRDLLNFRGQSKIKNYWLTAHIQRMVGSYVASATAFVVVNNTIMPSIVAWLLPTLILVPLIVKWTRKYKVAK